VPVGAWEGLAPKGSPTKTVVTSIRPSLPGAPSTDLISHCQRNTGWLRNLGTLEFGNSFKDNQPVWRKIAERLPITIRSIRCHCVIYLVAIPLGVYLRRTRTR